MNAYERYVQPPMPHGFATLRSAPRPSTPVSLGVRSADPPRIVRSADPLRSMRSEDPLRSVKSENAPRSRWRIVGWANTAVDVLTRVLLLVFLLLVVTVAVSAVMAWQQHRALLGPMAGGSLGAGSSAGRGGPAWHLCAQCKWRFKCRVATRSVPTVGANQQQQQQQQQPQQQRPAAFKAQAARPRPVAGYRRRTVFIGDVPIDVADSSPVCCLAQVNGTSHHVCSFSCYKRLAQLNSAGHSIKSTESNPVPRGPRALALGIGHMSCREPAPPRFGPARIVT